MRVVTLSLWLAFPAAALAQSPAEPTPAAVPTEPAAAPADPAAPVEGTPTPVEGAVQAEGAMPAPVPTEAPPEAPPTEPMAEPEPEPEPESPFTLGLITSFIALAVGGGSAVLGIWVDRDKTRPTIFAFAMSLLIIAAVTVGALQGYLDSEGAIAQRADLERMLGMVDEMAASSDDPALAELAAKSGQHRRKGGKASKRGGE